jgi:hypothetical protein
VLAHSGDKVVVTGWGCVLGRVPSHLAVELA